MLYEYSYQINNVRVLSNDAALEVSDETILFRDKSVIDLKRRTRSSEGAASRAKIIPAGFIHGEGYETEAEKAAYEAELKPKTVTHSFALNSLMVQDVPNARLKVLTHSAPTGGIMVTIEGSTAAVDKITVRERNQVVEVSGNPGGSGGNFQSIIGNVSGDSVTIISGSIIIGNAQTLIDITVTVPVGAAIDLKGTWASAEVGDTLGPISVRSSGTKDITIGKVKEAKLSAEYRGGITVKETDGPVVLHSTGWGNILVEGGKASPLDVIIEAHGSINFQGEGKIVTIKDSGHGNAFVESALQRLVTNVASHGGIIVNHVQLEEMRNYSSGHGETVIGNGFAGKSSVDSSSAGGISVMAEVTSLKGKSSGSGDIKFMNGYVKELDWDLSSRGSFFFGGKAEVVTLDSSGSGEAYFIEVLDQLIANLSSRGGLIVEHAELNSGQITSTGSGDVVLNNGKEAKRFIVRVTSRGNVTYHGTIVDGELDSSGSGDIFIDRGIGQIRERKTSRGNITIERRN